MRGCKRSLFVLIGVLTWLAMVPGGAAANGGPPHDAGDKAGVLLPGKSSTVHVLGEALRFVLDEDLHEAEVTARYELENRGESVTLPVVFVIQDLGYGDGSEPVITWNGEPRQAVRLGTSGLSGEELRQMREAWGGEEQVIDPVTGERYGLTSYGGTPVDGDEYGMAYYRFDLVLPAGADGTLEVTYRQQAGYDRTRYVNRVHHYQYLLLPARSWASFGPLEIEVQAPPASGAFFASSLPLIWSDGAYRARFPGLPDQNLTFSLMSRQGIIGRMVDSGPYYWMTATLLMLLAGLEGVGLGWLLARIPSRGWAIVTTLVGSLGLGAVVNPALTLAVFGLFSFTAISGYADTPFVGLFQWFLSVLITLLAALVAQALYRARRTQVG